MNVLCVTNRRDDARDWYHEVKQASTAIECRVTNEVDLSIQYGPYKIRFINIHSSRDFARLGWEWNVVIEHFHFRSFAGWNKFKDTLLRNTQPVN